MNVKLPIDYHIPKALSVLIALLFSTFPIHGQNLKVDEFRQAMEPMTVPMQRLDANNSICALVKVLLPIDGVGFEGNVVGAADFKINEYWVYLTPGTKMLNIKAPGHYPLLVNFANLGYNGLESKAIYYLKVVSEGTVAAPAKPAVTANYLIMTITPRNALVKIDGQLRETVDGTVTALLKPGRHTYSAEAPGYTSDSGSFNITVTDKTQLSIALKSERATLHIVSDPDVAIFIDGVQKTSGSWQGEMAPGLYNIELRKPGCKPYTETIEMGTDNIEIAFNEFTQVYGTLSVDYRPVGAQIYLDNKKIGETPQIFNNIPIGNHIVRIEHPNYATITTQVTINEYTPQNLSGTLNQASDEKTFEAVEEPPQFPGGDAALMKFISQNLRYPPYAAENNIQGRVIVRFVVTKTGEIGEVKIGRGKDPSLDQEAMRVVRQLPRFIPAKQNGTPVNVWFNLPITFKLQGADEQKSKTLKPEDLVRQRRKTNR
ncbi:MAG: TonB family protein [Muribaculum sp.]|nr:TonB family protein [Muribaculaceae bacterium]MCM1081470.1 TonB family protein [Muribaculum sp.]